MRLRRNLANQVVDSTKQRVPFGAVHLGDPVDAAQNPDLDKDTPFDDNGGPFEGHPDPDRRVIHDTSDQLGSRPIPAEVILGNRDLFPADSPDQFPRGESCCIRPSQQFVAS